jgi:hypothetical protein
VDKCCIDGKTPGTLEKKTLFRMGSKQLLEDVAVSSQKNLVSEDLPQLALTLRRIDNARLSKNTLGRDGGHWDLGPSKRHP